MMNRHEATWPQVAYEVKRVGVTWFRTAPNFRQIIASEDPRYQELETPREQAGLYGVR